MELRTQCLPSPQRVKTSPNLKTVLEGVSFEVKERRVGVGGAGRNWEPGDFTSFLNSSLCLTLQPEGYLEFLPTVHCRRLRQVCGSLP